VVFPKTTPKHHIGLPAGASYGWSSRWRNRKRAGRHRVNHRLRGKMSTHSRNSVILKETGPHALMGVS
jgi:hypothetical protein